MRKPKKYIFAIASLILLSFLYGKPTLAIGLTKPFGGKVTAIIPCKCQWTAWMLPEVVIVGPPRGGAFLKTIFTRLYSYYAVAMGNNVLGQSTSIKLPCMQPAGFACTPPIMYDFMIIVGTSK